MRTGTRCTTLIQLPVAFCAGMVAKVEPVPPDRPATVPRYFTELPYRSDLTSTGWPMRTRSSCTSLKFASTCTSASGTIAQQRRAGLDLLADLHRAPRDHAVDRRADDGALQVHLRLVAARARQRDFGIGVLGRVRDQHGVGAARADGRRVVGARLRQRSPCALSKALRALVSSSPDTEPDAARFSRRCRSIVARSRSARGALFVRGARRELRRQAGVVGDVATHAPLRAAELGFGLRQREAGVDVVEHHEDVALLHVAACR